MNCYVLGLQIMRKGQYAMPKAANLCNQFLLDYLAKKRSQLERTGMQRKAFVYQGASASIKKYPLPIISAQQLKLIYGIGELLCEELMIVIKHHYKDFLKNNQQKIGSIPSEPQAQNADRIAENDEQTINKTNSKSLAHTSNFLQSNQCDDYLEDESKRSLSVKSATVDRQYKPRPNSLAAYIVIQLRNIGKGEFVSQQNLKQVLKREHNQNAGKQYSMAVANLIKSGHIQRDEFDQTYVRLTQKGMLEVEKLENKTKIKESQAKVQGLALSFRENRLYKKSNLLEEKEKSIIQKVETQLEKKLVLLIDSRQVKDQQEQCFFETRLQDRHGVACKSANLPIGDFVWLYGDQVLDYVVERKKADDLISSIFDGRYKQQKYRLKSSGFSNIYYLFEGHLTGSNAMSEREVTSALMKTRIKDHFKVIQVKSITESIKFLSFLTEKIQKKIDFSHQIPTLGTLEEFTANNGKTCNLTIEHIFGLSLKTIPGVGKASVSQVLKYFSSFKSLYNQLKLLNTHLERTEFLREVLKGGGVQRMLPQLLVDLLFDNSEK